MHFKSSDFDLDDIGNLSELGLNKLAEIRLLVAQYFKYWKPQVLALSDIDEDNVGTRIIFETEFGTKNVPGPDRLASFKLTGNIQEDPHIHCKIGGRKIYVSIDPRCITADTAFSLFKSSRIRFSGLGILNTVTATEARITPIVIGSPNYQDSEHFVGSSLIHL